MSTLEIVTKEIVDLHEFFTEWFNGTADRDQLGSQFLSRLDENVVFIPPEGHILTGEMLKGGFDRDFGTNKGFRIRIRDVTIRREVGDLVMATYTEWQVGATQSERENARVTSVLMKMTSPVTWLHIQETWLPDSARDVGSFDF
ncbi:nuclear transport factor 2 family protein [uncultured Ruegeria sp.]|uniref:nuclear transport factor 2 family protein n=1 Tax=uncultured Ruegeria sp. TaxID=259304 RepID=UPI002631ABA9|nr:nuclear transport factor 2 family protein [uncultured Ruegeria sp.]